MEHQLNWYRAQVVANVFVAIFAAATLWVGYQQHLTLREANRPSIATWFEPIEGHPPQAGKKLRYELNLFNSGKVAVMANIKSVITYSLQEPDAPTLPDVETQQLVWPGATVSETIWGMEEMTEGQMRDMEAGRGYISMRAVITYGEYHTNICSVLEVRKADDPSQPSRWVSPHLCKKTGSNSIK